MTSLMTMNYPMQGKCCIDSAAGEFFQLAMACRVIHTLMNTGYFYPENFNARRVTEIRRIS